VRDVHECDPGKILQAWIRTAVAAAVTSKESPLWERRALACILREPN